MKFYTQLSPHISPLDVATINGHYFLQVGPEAGADSDHGASVHIGHGVLDGCLEIHLVAPAAHLTLQDAPHKVDERNAVWQ